ncbi:MAG: ABC transporter ATP-binding protein, partial [Oscillibacter sp.]
ILKRPKVLILDDSTSAVDTATDASIRRTMAGALQDTTKLIIAQRVSSIMGADLIVILDDGAIVQQGTHEELLKTSEIYRDIYTAQQEGVSMDG